METGTKVAVGAGLAVAATAAVVATRNLGSSTALATDISAGSAARFLTQCTFGVTDNDIASVQSLGFSGWIDQQMAMTPFSMLTAVRKRIDETTGQKPYRTDGHGAFVEAFWQGAITRPDQLRQRMQFALSQIFVVTRENEELEFNGSLATTNYYDLLGANAFKNWRDLFEIVTLNPMVGIFLSYVTNDKEDPASGRTPDENYARESMQLFSIGTVLLNQDGTPQLDASGNTIPTYSHDDIAGLAKVFTGISWFSPSGPDESSWLSSAYSYFNPPLDVGDSTTKNTPVQMMYYPKHHSLSEKKFLGVTIPASTISDPAGDVKIALDTLFHHQNTAPYFAKRLIQQFITSNPSPAFVKRVADVFDNNGQGVRGDLGAVLKAILLDPDARNDAGAQSDPNFGKLREPIIRLTNWARTFKATSKRGHYSIGETGAPDDLNQGILDAPSVFNFWRAGYVFPHSRTGNLGLVAPEFQVVSELTAASYLNLIQNAIKTGAGVDQVTFSGVDVSSAYTSEVAIAADANALLDRLNTLLFYGQMSAGLRTLIVNAVNKVTIPTDPTKQPAALKNRAKLAITLSMVSGEYLVQR
jgi:uncharacterized protein (DUF1800 family)